MVYRNTPTLDLHGMDREISRILVNEFIPTQAYLSLRDGIDMAQYSECGKCPGILDNNGHYQNVDINYANEDLKIKIEQGGFNMVKNKKRIK